METRNPPRPIGIPRPPRLPRPLSLPLGLLPKGFSSQALASSLNRLFREDIEDGELDFLEGRVLLARIADARLELRLTLQGDCLRAASESARADLQIDGDLYDFLLLASRREDADTLFFQRRLRLSGDTELGLYLKNFLDAFEPDQRWSPLLRLLDSAARLAERFG